MPLNIAVLERSFELVKPQAGDFAATFYDSLFGDYPDVRPLFAHVDMRDQREKLLSALVLLVQHLRQPEALAEALRRLGARHVQYGVRPEHYALFWDVLLRTFALALGDAWTTEVEQAWAAAYDEVIRLMLAGGDDLPPATGVTQETLLSYWLQEADIVV